MFKFNLGKLKFPKLNVSKLSTIKARPSFNRSCVNNLAKICTNTVESSSSLPTIPNPNIPTTKPKVVIPDSVKAIGSTLLTVAANECLNVAQEAVTNYADNYTTRREAGFQIPDAATGAAEDTAKYYADTFTGKTPKKPIQAIYFDD